MAFNAGIPKKTSRKSSFKSTTSDLFSRLGRWRAGASEPARPTEPMQISTPSPPGGGRRIVFKPDPKDDVFQPAGFASQVGQPTFSDPSTKHKGTWARRKYRYDRDTPTKNVNPGRKSLAGIFTSPERVAEGRTRMERAEGRTTRMADEEAPGAPPRKRRNLGVIPELETTSPRRSSRNKKTVDRFTGFLPGRVTNYFKKGRGSKL